MRASILKDLPGLFQVCFKGYVFFMDSNVFVRFGLTHFFIFSPNARTLVDGSSAPGSPSPESPVPKPVAPDRSSLIRRSCFLRSKLLARFSTGSGFDEPFAPWGSLRVPSSESLTPTLLGESRVRHVFANPEPELPGEPVSSDCLQKIIRYRQMDVKKNNYRSGTLPMLGLGSVRRPRNQ